jgi:hypothetical protein
MNAGTVRMGRPVNRRSFSAVFREMNAGIAWRSPAQLAFLTAGMAW